MYYELKGRLLAIAIKSRKDHISWREYIQATLQEINPAIDEFFVSESVYRAARVAGVCVSEGIDLRPYWKPAKNDIADSWRPNKRYAAGKRFAKTIDELPKEPDPVELLLNELGFRGRFLQLSDGRCARPRFAILPKTNRAFLHWDEQYPSINDPDLQEVTIE